MPATPARIVALCTALVALSVAPEAVAEQKREFIGSFGDWEAFYEGEGKSRLCYAASIPRKKVGKYRSRGDVQAFVTHSANGKIRDEVSVTTGYTYRKNSQPRISIGKSSYRLFVNGDTAWARDKKTDRALVRAMRRGRTMIVRGTSKRGTKTKDTYSLKGFTAAYNEIKTACGIK